MRKTLRKLYWGAILLTRASIAMAERPKAYGFSKECESKVRLNDTSDYKQLSVLTTGSSEY